MSSKGCCLVTAAQSITRMRNFLNLRKEKIKRKKGTRRRVWVEHKFGKFQKFRVIAPCSSAIDINTILLLELINNENATILSQFLLSNSASDELCNYKHSYLQPRQRSNCSWTEPKFQLQKFRTIEEIGRLSVGSYGMPIQRAVCMDRCRCSARYSPKLYDPFATILIRRCDDRPAAVSIAGTRPCKALVFVASAQAWWVQSAVWARRYCPICYVLWVVGQRREQESYQRRVRHHHPSKTLLYKSGQGLSWNLVWVYLRCIEGIMD